MMVTYLIDIISELVSHWDEEHSYEGDEVNCDGTYSIDI
jgi:hypothetical protein